MRSREAAKVTFTGVRGRMILGTSRRGGSPHRAPSAATGSAVRTRPQAGGQRAAPASRTRRRARCAGTARRDRPDHRPARIPRWRGRTRPRRRRRGPPSRPSIRARLVRRTGFRTRNTRPSAPGRRGGRSRRGGHRASCIRRAGRGPGRVAANRIGGEDARADQPDRPNPDQQRPPGRALPRPERAGGRRRRPTSGGQRL
jgi:hypothetical protein